MIDINIFESSREVRSTGNPAIIRDISLHLCNLGETERMNFQALVGELFSPVDNDIVKNEVIFD